jgi:holo-[acyl-carrier protein] synthase
MIIGIGTDIVAVTRFADWRLRSEKSLSRIFHEEEIAYCLADTQKNAARFAARFAAREALWKALSLYSAAQKIPFLSFCKNVWVEKKNDVPQLAINWHIIQKQSDLKDMPRVHLSLAHEKQYALAFVILEIGN